MGDQKDWGDRAVDGLAKSAQFVQDSARQVVRERGEEKFRRGFQTSAGITARLIDGKLDAFKERMRGSGLTKADQAAYAALDELKSEIDAECDRYWGDSDVDWRPIKPIVKGGVTIRRRSDEDDGEDGA